VIEMKKYIGSYSQLEGIRLIVISEKRDEAWSTITDTGAIVANCSASMNKFNCQGDIEGGTLMDIEKLERDGWIWLGSASDVDE
jgi:hypothetical protein